MWDACFGQTVRRLLVVAVRYLRHRQALGLDESRQDQVGIAGGGRHVERIGPGAGQRNEFAERFHVQGCRSAKRNHNGGDVRDRQQVTLRIVRKLFVRIGVRREGRGRNEQQRVVVVGAGEGGDG